MKKVFLKLVVLNLIFLAFLVLPIKLAMANTDSDYESFLSDYREYQNIQATFNVAKGKYLTYRSVVSQGEFLVASRGLLKWELISMISLVKFLKTYLYEATEITQYNENEINIKLEEKSQQLQSILPNVDSFDSLSKIQSELTNLNQLYTSISKLSYQSKSAIEMAGVKKIYENLGVEKSQLKDFLSTIATSSPQAQASLEKYGSLEQIYNQISQDISKTYEMTAEYDIENADEPKLIAKNVRLKVNKIVENLSQLLLGYQNIMFAVGK